MKIATGIRPLIIVALLAPLSSYCQADPEWLALAQTPKVSFIHIDVGTRSIMGPPDARLVWTRATYDAQQPRHVLERRYLFHCGHRETFEMVRAVEPGDGTVTMGTEPPRLPETGSEHEAIGRYVCRREAMSVTRNDVGRQASKAGLLARSEPTH